MDNNIPSKRMQAKKIDRIELDEHTPVRVSRQGTNHCEVVYMARPSHGGCTIKLNADEYLDTRTGEVKQFSKNEKKQRDNLTETFRNLAALIRCNFNSGEDGKQLFVTLTYTVNMTDHHRLMSDYELWYKRLKRHLKGHTLEYIAVAEPQERGAWHMHVMLKSNKYLYINPDVMEYQLWGHGFTSTERLKSDDMGRYYVAYFTDLFGEKGEKAKIKGGRLHMYPVGMKFYRCSQGIKRPVITEELLSDIRKEWGHPSFVETYEVRNDISEVIQTIQREHYKRQ